MVNTKERVHVLVSIDEVFKEGQNKKRSYPQSDDDSVNLCTASQ